MNIVNHKKTILIIITVLIVFFAYWFIFVSKNDVAKQSNTQSLNTNLKNQINVSNTPYDKEFVSSLLGLNSVKLDVSVFETQAYKALNYPEVPFVINYSKESGRNNPFLPIGIDSGVLKTNIQTQNKKDIQVSSTTQPVPTTLKSSTSSVSVPVPTPKKF